MSLSLPELGSWSWIPLSDVVEFQEGPGVRKHQYTEKGVKLLNGSNINDNRLDLTNTDRFVSDKEANGRYSHFLVEEGDLLIACSGIVVEKFDGKIAYAKKHHLPLCMNTSTMRFQTKDSNVLHLHYFRWFLSTRLFKDQLRKLITGSAQLNFGPSHIEQMFVPLPPLEEQKRIAAILDKADAIRRKRQQAIELADRFLRSVFLDMFGDPVENPMKWEARELKDLSTKILSGSTPKGGSKVYVEKGIAFLRSQNVWKNNLVLEDLVYIDQVTHANMGKSHLKHGDILMTKTGRINTENSSLGRAAIFLGKDDSANINGHVYLIRLQDGAVNEFILYILTTNEYRDYIRKVCVGGIDKRQINKGHLEQFPIICPPVNKQQKFAKIFQAIEVQKELEKHSLIEAENLFSTLNQKAFQGDLFHVDAA